MVLKFSSLTAQSISGLHYPLPPIPDTLKATKFAKRCLQKSMLQTSSFGVEDCLHLNIWVPHGLYGTVRTDIQHIQLF